MACFKEFIYYKNLFKGLTVYTRSHYTCYLSILQSIVNNIHHALPALSNVQRCSVYSTYMPVPEPLEPRDFKAKEMFPYRSLIGQ